MNFDPGAVALIAAVAVAVAYAVWRGRRQSKIFEEVDRVTSQVNEFTLRVVELELKLSGYRMWNAQLRGQIIELRAVPIAPPTWLILGEPIPIFDAGWDDETTQAAAAAASEAPGDSTLVAVYDLLLGHFSLDDITELAFRMGIDGDAFGGGDTLPGRAHALVMYAAKHLKLGDLVGTAARMRPAVVWPTVAAGNGH